MNHSTAPEVPDHKGWDHRLQAHLVTGSLAVQAAQDTSDHGPAGKQVAVDIEAAGLGALSFTIRCVTAAWDTPDGTVSILLDPRREDHKLATQAVLERAGLLVFHNAPYDIPPLVHHGLLALGDIVKVWDTNVAARMAYPDTTISKNLEKLAVRPDTLGMESSAVTMATAFKAQGHRTQAEGYATMDVDSPVYRMGAMADTVVTLRLGPVLVDRVVEYLTTNPLTSPAKPDTDRALALLAREQTTNQVMLRRSATGILVDQDYLARYRAEHQESLEAATGVLTAAGYDPEAGNLGTQLVENLEAAGELPASWPRTATGKLKADKAAMAQLEDHPLVKAQQRVASLGKISRYLEKVSGYAEITGRVHPQVGVLGASATGRMAYSEPELQQFPADARPILVPDPGQDWVSIDWSSIEPVVLANCAGDREFLAEFNTNPEADLYAPIQAAAGVTRKVAKVVVLAAMYGQGRQLLADTLTSATGTPHSVEDAGALQDRVFQAMPESRRLLDALRATGDQYGNTMTADGRRLSIPEFNGKYAGYKATNYFVQGSSYSVLSDTINRLEAMGLGDSIQLAMHDELVVTADAAAQVQAVMETPPDWLVSFCPDLPVFRTDANPLPGHWKYV